MQKEVKLGRPLKRNKVGRPATLSEETLSQIKDKVLEGKDYTSICRELDIPHSTLMSWKHRNVNGFYDKLVQYEMQRELDLAQQVGRKILSYNLQLDDGTINTKLASIQQREAEFVRSTAIVARKLYDKREAQSSGAVTINVVNFNNNKDNKTPNIIDVNTI